MEDIFMKIRMMSVRYPMLFKNIFFSTFSNFYIMVLCCFCKLWLTRPAEQYNQTVVSIGAEQPWMRNWCRWRGPQSTEKVRVQANIWKWELINQMILKPIVKTLDHNLPKELPGRLEEHCSSGLMLGLGRAAFRNLSMWFQSAIMRENHWGRG